MMFLVERKNILFVCVDALHSSQLFFWTFLYISTNHGSRTQCLPLDSNQGLLDLKSSTLPRASDFFQDWWAEVTHGAKKGGSFSEMMGPSISNLPRLTFE